uniref:Secreted protein n=1 Tax=Pyxicephalus adspersus TaxID=30357 RepID=A0AAV3AAJ5_PYXAD|nr:TPA: hypothetical protein GDO54_010638 [Pyxicephalus adspersus]
MCLFNLFFVLPSFCDRSNFHVEIVMFRFIYNFIFVDRVRTFLFVTIYEFVRVLCTVLLTHEMNRDRFKGDPFISLFSFPCPYTLALV